MTGRTQLFDRPCIAPRALIVYARSLVTKISEILINTEAPNFRSFCVVARVLLLLRLGILFRNDRRHEGRGLSLSLGSAQTLGVFEVRSVAWTPSNFYVALC